MTATCLALVGCVACTAASPARPPPVDPADAPHSTLADEDTYPPTYGKPELQNTLSAERVALTTLERQVAQLEAKEPDAAADDPLRVALADLAVRRRFIATLEACEAAGRWCPPRLDDPPWAFDPDRDPSMEPPLTAPLRFDLDGWRGLAVELHGRACACRTIACVDSVGVAIDQLELRPAQSIQGDEAATTSITRARECLFRLRGKAAIRPAAPADE